MLLKKFTSADTARLLAAKRLTTYNFRNHLTHKLSKLANPQNKGHRSQNVLARKHAAQYVPSQQQQQHSRGLLIPRTATEMHDIHIVQDDAANLSQAQLPPTQCVLPDHLNLAILQQQQPKPRHDVLNRINYFPIPVDDKTLLQTAFETFKESKEKSYMVYDVKIVHEQTDRWETNLPGVDAYYAVKCCPDPILIQTLADRGTGFDCASKAEIALALDTGVSPEKIIFANPIKSFDDLAYAQSVNVKKMTFDNVDELHKIKMVFPEAEVVLRLLPDDSGSTMRFGSKFGAPDVQVPELIKACKDLNLRLVGASFHIGSGCFDPSKYDSAIKQCKGVFDLAVEMGLPPLHLVDIGGGFPGTTQESESMSSPNEHEEKTPSFEAFSDVIRCAFDRHFPRDQYPHIHKIGEPGRYFGTAWGTLFAMVQGKREQPVNQELRGTGSEVSRSFLYYINDGVYGSFNSIIFDHFHPVFEAATDYFEEKCESKEVHDITIFGPTCDSMDVVVKNGKFNREMHVGDWLLFKNMGAYTTAAGSNFNGIQSPEKLYFSRDI